jgi:hypothetical protein
MNKEKDKLYRVEVNVQYKNVEEPVKVSVKVWAKDKVLATQMARAYYGVGGKVDACVLLECLSTVGLTKEVD